MRQLYQLFKAVTSRRIKVDDVLTELARLKVFFEWSQWEQDPCHWNEVISCVAICQGMGIYCTVI